MGRLIQEKIKQPLAEELLFGKLVHGGEVEVKLKDGELSFAFVPAAPKGSKKGGGKKSVPAKAK
jgi:ATP-dependent Clp protease ATP-binding subunit ClpA